MFKSRIILFCLSLLFLLTPVFLFCQLTDLDLEESAKWEDFLRTAYLQHTFDNLICNVDRRAGNVLVTEDWRCILIDHSRTFRTQKEYTGNLLFIDRNPEELNLMKELPDAFVQKLRDLIVQVIDTRIQKYGKAAILY